VTREPQNKREPIDKPVPVEPDDEPAVPQPAPDAPAADDDTDDSA
jgi:hypothetical protein